MSAADTLLRTLELDGGPRPGLAEAWPHVPAESLARLARYEGAELWLLRSLRDKRCEDAAPQPLLAVLRQRAREISAKTMLVDAEAQRVVDRLQAAAVPFVLIKGTARRALAHRYPFGDARPTVDVDVLLPDVVADTVWQRMCDDGYRLVSEFEPGYHRPAIAADGQVAVELHTALAAGMAPDEAWRRGTAGAREVSWSGRRVMVPSPTELLWHCACHAVRAEGSLGWRLRHLLDAATLLASGDALDWDTVRARLATGEAAPRKMRAWLTAASQLAGAALPDDLRQPAAGFDLSRVMHWRLRVLSRRDDAGMGARLLEEGTRCELDDPPAPRTPGAAAWKQARRWLASRAARAMYRWWRTHDGSAASG